VLWRRLLGALTLAVLAIMSLVALRDDHPGPLIFASLDKRLAERRRTRALRLGGVFGICDRRLGMRAISRALVFTLMVGPAAAAQKFFPSAIGGVGWLRRSLLAKRGVD